MRITFLGWGDHIHTERWAGAVARLGNDVTVLSTTGKGRYPDGVRQATLGAGRGRYRLRTLALRWQLWRHRPDILHVHWVHFAPLALAARWSGPLVITAWGSDIYQRERFSDADWQAAGTALRRADLVTCDSDDLAARIAADFAIPAERIVVVQWGVDTDLFTPATTPPGLLVESGFAGHPVILSPRNFAPIYNLETIVRAFARVHAAMPEVRLLLKRQKGDPQYNVLIESMLDQLRLRDSVRILEEVAYERMPEIYQSAQVTVSVPHTDAMPMAVLEAMASGSVPVVSDLPSLREWIVEGGNGALVPTTDDAALAERLLALLSDRDGLARMASANRALVEARYSQRMWMQRMQGHYERLLGRPR